MKWTDDFKNFNRLCFWNYFCQISLLSLLLYGFQWCISYCNVQYDFSLNKENSIHNEMRAFLGSLTEPLNIYLLQDVKQPDENFCHRFYGFLHALEKTLARRVDFHFEAVHVLQNPKKLLHLKKQYNFSENNGVVVALGKKSLFIPFEDFYTPKKTFCFEQTLQLAFIKLTSKTKKLYWTKGHQELDLCSEHPKQGASLVNQILKQMNCNSAPLDAGEPIPEDADCIFILGPQIPFLKSENYALHDYLVKRHGRIFICLHPIYEHGLHFFLETLGLTCNSGLVLDTSKDFMSNDGSLLIRRFTQIPMLKPLIDRNLGLVFGLTSELTLLSSNSQSTPCIFSSETSWTKSSLATNTLSFNEKTDQRGEKILGCFYELHKTDSLFQLKVSQGKVMIVSCADWLDNAHIQLLGNELFLKSICDWLCDMPQPIKQENISSTEQTKVVFSQQQFLLILLNLILFPFIFFTLGIIMFVVRKE